METSRIDGTRSKVPGVYVSVYRSMYRSLYSIERFINLWIRDPLTMLVTKDKFFKCKFWERHQDI